MAIAALHCWQLAGKTDVCVFMTPIQAELRITRQPHKCTLGRRPQPKLVPIFHPMKAEG